MIMQPEGPRLDRRKMVNRSGRELILSGRRIGYCLMTPKPLKLCSPDQLYDPPAGTTHKGGRFVVRDQRISAPPLRIRIFAGTQLAAVDDSLVDIIRRQ